jgi:hypothetical protein
MTSQSDVLFPFSEGATGLVVTVPQAEASAREVRCRYDTAAQFSMPAHITVLFPWLLVSDVSADVLLQLERLTQSLEPFDAKLVGTGRFPATLWLKPEPTDKFRDLTLAVWREWPNTAPYEGQHDSIVPHLTVADTQQESLLDELEHHFAGLAPIHFQVAELRLFVFDHHTWHQHASFSLGHT